MGSLFKIFAFGILPIVTCQYRFDSSQQQAEPSVPEQHDFLDIQSPEFFSFTPSPLAKPDSLRSRPYYDFLSTLYAHDTGKSSLFTQYPKSKRDIASELTSHHRRRRDVELSPILDALQNESVESSHNNIRKRAVVFRPLFVYRQQEIKKQKVQQNGVNRI